MNEYQEVLLITSMATFITFIILLFVKNDKSGGWVSWYCKLTRREKNLYNPSIALNRIKIVLLLTSIISFLGLTASIYIDGSFTKITYGAIIIIFILQVIYTGPKSSLIGDK